MQSEGIEVSAEMEFLTQQNIMLDLENKALKQRLESIAQEQVIKRGKYAHLYFFFLLILEFFSPSIFFYYCIKFH